MSEFKREYKERASWNQFFKVFLANTSECESYEEAYQQTEQAHRKIYGVKCYSSYNSFRNVKSRKQRKESL